MQDFGTVVPKLRWQSIFFAQVIMRGFEKLWGASSVARFVPPTTPASWIRSVQRSRRSSLRASPLVQSSACAA